jgi:outer membrane protein TolC
MAALCLALAASAVGALEMTLEECISKALEMNPTVRDGREAVAKARSGIGEARSGYMPYFSVAGSYNFAEKLQKIEIPGSPVAQEFDLTRDYAFRFTLSQPLYTGGRVSSSYRIAKHSEAIAEADLEARENDISLQVIDSFVGLLLAREAVNVIEQAIETAEEFHRVVKARYQTGEASHYEVLRAEVEVANLRPGLVTARNGIALSELALKRVMGIDPDEDVEFVGEFRELSFDVEVPTAIETAMEKRPELRIVEIQKDVAAQSVTLARSGYFPNVSLDFNYDFLSNSITVDSDKIDQTYAGYVNLNFPIFDGLKTRSQVAQARTELKQAEIAETDLKDAIQLEVRSAILEVIAARERLDSQAKNVEAAQEGLDIANERYLQGYATNLEVMDAQLALIEAQKNRLEAISDLHIAVAGARRAMGILLEDRQTGDRR